MSAVGDRSCDRWQGKTRTDNLVCKNAFGKAICPLAARWPIEYDHLIYNSVQSVKRFLYAKNNRLDMNILTTMGRVQKHHSITLGCHSIFVYVQWTMKIEWHTSLVERCFWTQSSRESGPM